ncbi:uncharacterized protein LOC114541315 isoform X2 [Dendronephthya gigantea]|uniref:uncharacterized protein LOC114541315 isoform X2 n=1 Tax=Dendronephthya gigantea TaxID=151771 RepID=UPI001069372B|nr:uncharacterized protein LOC114541315 isoform X2 [Dendronephthya gigantea]
MGVQHLEMRRMIDSALGHPEKGIVNLNILHSLLHEILNHLDKKTSNNDAAGSGKDEIDFLSERKPYQSDANIDPAKNGEETSNGSIGMTGSKENLSSESLNEFEARLASIEAKLSTLENLSVDKSFLAQSANSDDSHTTAQDKKENALAMMWKYMKIQKRVQATEEAVEKVMNILNDVIEDVGQLKNVKSNLEELRKEQMKMSGAFDTLKSGGELTSNSKRKLDHSDEVAFKSDLAPFVTWTALEQALNKREVEAKGVVTADDGGEEHVMLERPDTEPVTPSSRDVPVDHEPPTTAMSPKEDTKHTGENPDESKPFVAKEAPLSSKENSLSEISLNLDENMISQEETKDAITTDKPSPELLNQLNRIGELPKQYDDVAVQVSMMSELQTKLASDVHKVEVDILPRKVDKEDLQLPENLVEQISMLKQGLDMLNTNQDLKMLATIKETSIKNKENIDNIRGELSMLSQHLKRLDQLREVKPQEDNVPSYDREVLNSVREKLNSVEQDQEKMVLKSKEDIDKILENLDEKQRTIDGLFQYVERLQERKADRENVANEMDIKADKHALEGKVNQSTFDETFQMFDRGLQEALQKMEDYMNEEMALKDTLSRISREMEGKIDNDSLQMMKNYFEKQIKDVQDSRDKIVRETRVDATANAAGVRRKLPIHYHCISCNRPVELAVRDSEPTLPESESLPLRRMKIPFTSYDVEQLRQKSMKNGQNAEESTAAIRDLVSGRPCGGSHTLINSHLRKSTKVHQYNQAMSVREDSRYVPKLVREVSVLDFLRGSDGHYYKGRSKQLLPAIPRRAKYPSNADVSPDTGSYVASGPLQDEPSQTTDREKTGTHYFERTPSPPVQDNLSSSYPEISDPKSTHIQGQRYSSDDINLPSNTALNRESLKIFRRKRGQEKDSRRERCWDGQLTKEEGTESNESTSPKSMKRTTPLGEEQPRISSPAGSPQKPQGIHNDTTGDISRVKDSDKEH